MFRRLKDSAVRITTAVAVVTFLIGLAIASSFKQAQISSARSIQSSDNVSNLLDRRAALTVRKSRKSAVNVMSISEDGFISSSSGTYFVIGDRHYIITVSHGIVGGCASVRILSAGHMTECIRIAMIDRDIDYAIIEVEQIPARTPIRIPQEYPNNRDWERHLAIQRTVYYTGYPNGSGPLTFEGQIAGHDNSENIYMHSFAWPGSSGSGVFSETGEMIGLIVAISVGATDYGIDVLEDVVIVIPLYKIDWNML
jgi:hypothetical protein